MTRNKNCTANKTETSQIICNAKVSLINWQEKDNQKSKGYEYTSQRSINPDSPQPYEKILKTKQNNNNKKKTKDIQTH